MKDHVKAAAEVLLHSRRPVALTGAGISVASGIPPFRGKGSLWDTIDPMEYAHIRSFLRTPEKVWDVLLRAMKEVMDTARPNRAHEGLAKLEQHWGAFPVITQNVDGLHQMAGSSDVIEFHGSFARCYCMACNRNIAARDISLAALPPTCTCGGLLRPDCVFFGEAIPEDALYRSQAAASSADAMLVIGTSAAVYPAAELPLLARSSGATIIEINPEPTPLSSQTAHYSLRGPAASIMDQLLFAMDVTK